MSRQTKFRDRMKKQRRCVQCQAQDERTLRGLTLCFFCTEKTAERKGRNMGYKRRYKRGPVPGAREPIRDYSRMDVVAVRYAIEDDRVPEFKDVRTKRAMLKRADGILAKFGRKRSISGSELSIRERGLMRVCGKVVEKRCSFGQVDERGELP